MTAKNYHLSISKQLVFAFKDTVTMTKRNILRNYRLPQLIFFSTIQPIIFLLLFNYVFGGAVSQGNGSAYINFLLPGILVQTTLFGSIQTGVGLAEDLQKGVVDRFRSLPMSRVAHIAGRVFADTMRNILVVLLMILVGLLIGFRIHNDWFVAIWTIPLVLVFSFAFSWVASLFGLFTKDSETAQVLGFMIVFPITFASSIFVPPETMPSWLQGFATNQPVSHAADAVRALTQGGALDSVWKTLVWTLVILVVAVPVAIQKYRNTV